jgi:hypothetical protein
MKNGSYFVEREKLKAFMKAGAMNEEEGLYIFGRPIQRSRDEYCRRNWN